VSASAVGYADTWRAPKWSAIYEFDPTTETFEMETIEHVTQISEVPKLSNPNSFGTIWV
jgi:hypothetical protein